MNKHFLITLLVVAGMTATVQADQSAIYGIGVNENAGLGLDLDHGIAADVGPLGFGLRGETSDADNYQKMKNNPKRKKYTGSCDCEKIMYEMTKLEKNKDNAFILHLGVRNSKYKKLQAQYIDCDCDNYTPKRQRRGQ